MEKQCQHCRKTFNPKRNTKKFCSETCKQYAYLTRHGLQVHRLNIVNNVNDDKKDTDANEDLGLIENSELTIKIPEIKTEEKIYFTRPQIIQLIEEELNNQHYFNSMIAHPESRWNEREAMIIKWFNIRFKCILNNLIRLSYKESIFSQTLDALSSALHKMCASTNFKMLPNNYPYKFLLQELEEQIRVQSERVKQYGELKFTLSQKKKAGYIVILYNLSNLTPLRKFSELSFE